MKTIAHYIVKHRLALFCIFVVLAALGLACLPQVTVNSDMNKYLPAAFETKIGTDIMDDAFPETTTIQLMTEGQTLEQREQLAERLGDFSSITSVSYDSTDSSCNKDEYGLFTITVLGDRNSDNVSNAEMVIEKVCGSMDTTYHMWTGNDNAPANMGIFLVASVSVAMIILFVLANSWIEPFLILLTIVIAVLINMGSNIMFESISSTSSAVGAILQMALSMDYLIMLLNRFRRERDGAATREEAMERAIAKGVPAIASSSLTTVAGLLCLSLMSFTIGMDMGLVLAKGVFLSLICAFCVMPYLALRFDDLMDRTAKPSPHPKMKLLTGFSYKLRVPLLIVFVVLLAGGLGLKNLDSAEFTIVNPNDEGKAIQAVFGEGDQQMVVLYDASDQGEEETLVAQLETLDGVSSVTAYSNSIGEEKGAAAMAEDAGVDEQLVRLVYYYALGCNNSCDTGLTLTGAQLADFVRTDLAAQYGTLLGDSLSSKTETLATAIESKLSEGSYTTEQAGAFLSDAYRSIDADTVALLYMAYGAAEQYDENWTMSLDEFTSCLANKVLDESVFSSMISNDQRDELLSARDKVETARDQLLSGQWARLLVSTPYGVESSEMSGLCTQVSSLLDATFGSSETATANEHYLVGQGPIVQEMRASFSDEFNFVTWATILTILLVVGITFGSVVIPVVLVSLIQTAFCWLMILNGTFGSSIYYICLMVVQSILMGATIDYAILYTTNYREARATMDIRTSIGQAYEHSIRTIMMSGLILVLVCLVMGYVSSGVTSQICMVISIGSAIALLLVLVLLPGTIAAMDRFVVKRRKKTTDAAQTSSEAAA